MLGYHNNKTIFTQGDMVTSQLKTAVSMSGGTNQHFNLFNYLLSYSIWNRTLNGPIHDTRAAQTLLFIFPPSIRVFLALILYKEEINITDDYKDEYDLSLDIGHPLTSIELSTIINQSYISPRILNTLRDINEDVILTDDHLRDIKLLLNIKEKINFENRVLRENLERVFNTFNSRNPVKDIFIQTAYTNNRRDAAVAICNALRYKRSSTTLILQTIERWQLKTSNT